MAQFIIRVARQALLAALFVTAAVLGTTSGVLFVYAADLPQISALDNYSPNTITRILAGDGTVVGEFATERREVVAYDAISPHLRQAIISSEDQEFDQHFGLSIPRIVIALVRDILQRRKASGASTLTQQLARNLFLTPEKTWERKVKEAILAIQIEKRYTKREIFSLYANQIYFGHGAYGVEAASRVYFGKPARDLLLEEAALIAGIIQSPSRQSPYVNMDAALRRRNYALSRMAEDGYITPDDATAARERPIKMVGLPNVTNSVAPFFVEEVRKHLESTYGAKQLYENGLTVRTTLDVALQQSAQDALQFGLRALDKRRGFRGATRNLIAEGQDPERVALPRWNQPVTVGDIVPALVTSVDAAVVHLRVGPRTGEIQRAGFAWTRKSVATAVAKPG
ncbi:MAG: transglycosylase domain-containing protein, partial [Vicinamibacterales bacterium]